MWAFLMPILTKSSKALQTNYKAAGYLTGSLGRLGDCLKRYAERKLQLPHRNIGVCVADDATVRAIHATRT